MNITSNFSLETKDLTEKYYSLLSEEDFDFKTKNISIDVKKASAASLKININCDSVMDLKIGSNALIKSLEIIDKTLKV